MSRRFHISVTAILSLAFLALTAVFCQSYVRFAESCRDFGLSAAYYFCELFGIDYSFTPTVTEYSEVLQWEILCRPIGTDLRLLQRNTLLCS